MTSIQGSRLDTGDLFPDIQVKTTTGPIDFPSDVNGQWSIILIYRGDW